MKINKKNIIIFCCLILLLLIILFCITRTSHNNKEIIDETRDYPEIKNSGVLNIVTEYNLSDYYISNDSVTGLQYELSKYIEKRAGLKVNIFLENNIENSISKLKKNEYDIIALNIPITSEIKKELSFTNPISKDRQILVQRKKDEKNPSLFINNQIELANKTIYIPQNSSSILRIVNLSNEIAEPIHFIEDINYTAEQLIYKVAYEEIDYAVINEETAKKNISLFDNIDINTDISFNQLQAWALRKTSPILLDSLNVWIDEYQK